VCVSILVVTLLPWQRSGCPEGMPLAFWSLKHPTKLISFFVNRSDDQPHRYPNIDERCLRKLQAGLDGFRHRIRDFQVVELAGVRSVPRARNDGEVGALGSRGADDGLHRLGVTTSARAR
jgi:hypothetical protein